MVTVCVPLEALKLTVPLLLTNAPPVWDQLPATKSVPEVEVSVPAVKLKSPLSVTVPEPRFTVPPDRIKPLPLIAPGPPVNVPPESVKLPLLTILEVSAVNVPALWANEPVVRDVIFVPAFASVNAPPFIVKAPAEVSDSPEFIVIVPVPVPTV